MRLKGRWSWVFENPNSMQIQNGPFVGLWFPASLHWPGVGIVGGNGKKVRGRIQAAVHRFLGFMLIIMSAKWSSCWPT